MNHKATVVVLLYTQELPRNPHPFLTFYKFSLFVSTTLKPYTRSGFREFVDIFLGSIDPSNPYNYKTHFLQYLNNEQELDILFLKYEEVDQNPDKAVRNILEHLGLSEVTFSKKEVQGMLGVREENILTSWDVISKSVRTSNFSSFFDTDLLLRFDEELKVDWKLVNSGNV